MPDKRLHSLYQRAGPEHPFMTGHLLPPKKCWSAYGNSKCLTKHTLSSLKLTICIGDFALKF